MPRATSSDLKRIINKQKYGISSSIGKRGVGTKIGDSGAKHDLEPTAEDELEGSKGLQISYTGKVCVSIRFYRHRLADYGTENSRAISEKAIIDTLQYSGAIRGDSGEEIRLIDLGQVKVANKSEERTEITLEYGDVDFDNLFVATGRTDGR